MKTRNRPKLTEKISLNDFRDFYWLKEELIPFCKKLGISTEGRKPDIQKRIETYLITGKIIAVSNEKSNTRDSDKTLTVNTPVINFKSDDKTREFFKKQIGSHFHFTSHMNRFREQALKNGKRLTYGDLITEWEAEFKRRKNPNYKPEILDSCEYNRFVRDFRADKRKRGEKADMADIASAWNKVKAQPGPRVYKSKNADTQKGNHYDIRNKKC